MLSEAEARDAVILALDCPLGRAWELADELEGRLAWVKVGMTMYYREGPDVVRRFRERGLRVFLDLKLFDIPFQVEGAATSAAATGADLISIHALGGREMLEAAVRGAAAGAAERGSAEPARTVAITVLTSMDQDTLTSIGVEAPVADEVARLARLARSSGASGCVCSPMEVRALREALGPDALLVTPGVRPAGADLGDQRRVATPGRAIADGASKIVIGRPLAGAADPKAAFDALVAEIRG